MLEADPQIIPAGDQGERRGRPQAHQADQMHPRHCGSAPARISAPSATSWSVVFHLASALTGTETCSSARNSRRPETMISRSRMTSAGMRCQSGDLRHRVALRLAISMTMHRADHDLVGDRIEELAEPRDRPLRAGEIAVEIIGDPDQAVEDEGDRIIERRSASTAGTPGSAPRRCATASAGWAASASVRSL